MADFKEHATRCRVHPSIGNPVNCSLDESQKETILASLLAYVRDAGEAEENPVTKQIKSIKVHSIESIDDRRGDVQNRSEPTESEHRTFWELPNLEELALEQNVTPVADIHALFGTWPGASKDNHFEALIEQLRHGKPKELDHS